MSPRIQNKKKKQSRQNSKTKKNIRPRTMRYSNKNKANKCKSMKGGALPIEDLIAIIESELGGVKLDDAAKTYYKKRYESFRTEKRKRRRICTYS